MDWGELVEQAQNNPELKSIISKMSGAAVEDDPEALIKAAGRPADVEAAYQGIPPSANKSAEESAQVFQQNPEAPNFILGDSSSTTPPNFRTQGEPYSGNVPATIPRVGGVPAVSDMTATRDVTPIMETEGKPATSETVAPTEALDQSKWLSEESGSTEPVEKEATASEQKPRTKLTTAQKIALGAGGVGGGATLLKMAQSDDEPSTDGNDIQARETAAIDSLTKKEEPKQPASQEEDEEDNDQEQDLKHASTKQPKDESQKSDQSADIDSVKAAMEKLLNFGTPEENKDKLQEALDKQRMLTKWAALARAGNTIGAGFARVKPNPENYNQMIKEASLPVQQYEMKQKNEVNDPNSGISKGMRDYLQQNLGIKVSDGATASQMQSVLPMVYKDVEAKQAQASHTADLENRLQAQQMMKEAQIESAEKIKQAQLAQVKANKDLATQQKQDQQRQTYDFKTGDALQRFKANPGLQNDLRAVQAANQALSTINNPQWKGNYNNIPGPVNEMLNTDLATIYSRGAASDNVIKELSNPTYMKAYENFVAKVGNHPTPAQQGAFVAQNKNLFQDLRDGSQNRINEHYRQILNTQGKMGTPEGRENYRQEFLPNDVYDKNGRLVPAHTLSDDELKQQWLKLQKAKGNI